MDIQTKLQSLAQFAKDELFENILPFWRNKAVDTQFGGFLGEMTNDLVVKPNAAKGLILNARILWSFSAAYQITNMREDLELATRAYDYICSYFFDKEYGGYYWTINHDGTPCETKKQIYALAFTMYGMSEYYKITHNEDALKRCFDIFALIEENSFDKKNNGYLEAFTRDWREIGDLRLSDKDMNEKKTMNTHLHIIEAYANLFTCKNDAILGEKVKNLVLIFLDKIISTDDFHLKLFFDENWVSKSAAISYGHDIEAGWLIHESAIIYNDKNLVERVEAIVPKITEAALQGVSNLGGLYHEADHVKKHYDYEFEWWPQAEALVGLINAYEVTDNEKYIDQAVVIKDFINEFFIDRTYGEWFYRVDKNGRPIDEHSKVGLWKCPYHNSRACIEIIKRIKHISKK